MSDILAGETIFLAEDHFDPNISEILQECMEDTGATYTAERKEASIVLINPSSSASKSEKDKAAAFAKKNPGIKQSSISYHWLSQCQLLGRKISLDELDPPEPIFTNPNHSKGYQPLRSWVSINLPRNDGETTPEDAQQAVQGTLIRGGALMVKKRGQADLLIVDPTSNFYNVIINEKKSKNRHGQKLAERDWVEDCFKNGKVVWVTEGDVEQAEESFGEEEVSRGAGPGRPTGIPRNEYSPEDDDFLIRYLAAFHSAGSWKSRKTYETLFARRNQYPVAGRHSAQSWHERFKKNASTFERRVERMVALGTDESLKTRKEREIGVEQPDGEDQAQAGPSKSTSRHAPGTAKQKEAGEVSSPKRPEKNDTAATAKPATTKKTLVGSDTESESLQPATPLPAPPQTASAQPAATSEVAGPSVPIAGPSSTSEPAGGGFESLLPPAPSITAAQRQLQGDSAIVDQSLGPAVPATQAQQPTESQGESQQTTSSNGHDSRLGAETQAIMSDFEKIRAKAMAKQPVPAPGAANRTEGEASTASVARGTSIPRSPRPTELPPPAKRARHEEPAIQAEPSRDAAAGRPSMPTPRSAMRAVRISETDDGTGRQRISIPVKLGFRVVGVTEEGSGTEESGAEGVAGRRGVETPSPGRNRSLLREQLVNSAQHSSSRRKSRLSHGSSIRRHHSPDTVYATPNIPPAIPRYPPSNGSITPRLPRPSPPPLSNREREQRVYEGQRIAKEMADRNRAELKRLCDKYGIRAKVLHDIVDKSKSTGEVSLPWAEIEKRLGDYFARQ